MPSFFILFRLNMLAGFKTLALRKPSFHSTSGLLSQAKTSRLMQRQLMASKATATAGGTSAPAKISDTLVFAKAVSGISKTSEELIKAMNGLAQLKTEALTNALLEITAKREELSLLEKEYETKKKDHQIKLAQELSEFGFKEALKIVEKNGHVAVPKEAYETIQKDNKELEARHAQEMETKIAAEKAVGEQREKLAVQKLTLEHTAATAELKATVEQLTKERATFESVIAAYKADIAAQRELTRQVAEAAKSGAITQTFGKQ